MKDKTSNDNAFLDEFFLSHIFSYLDWRSLLNCRRVDSTWSQSVAITPVQELFVSSHQIAKNIPEKLTKTFPKLKRLQYDSRSRSSKRFLIRDEFVIDGVVQFRELDQLILRHGDLRSCAPQILQLSHLTHLDVCCNTRLKWNLRDIAKHLPKLETLRCQFNRELVGSLTDLQPLKNSLRICDLEQCLQVRGDLLDLALFPNLQQLNVDGTKVVGDIRQIDSHHFPALSLLSLGDHIFGGNKIQSTLDAPVVMETLHRLQQERPSLDFPMANLQLAHDSPERYRFQGHYSFEPPFLIEVV